MTENGSPHLLLIHIGPVQDFIATARKCQDLWFGSWLLSELARTVAASIAGVVPGENVLVFPGEYKEKNSSVANKILSCLPAGVDPRETAKKARETMLSQLVKMADEEFDRIDRLVAQSFFNRSLALAQLKDMMEYFWVSVPLAPDYKTALDSAESFLAARKNTQNWQAVPWEEGHGVPKSSLDGQRESVLREKLFEKGREGDRNVFHVKRSERLCGIGLFKRLGTAPDSTIVDRPAFHSTSHTAAGPLLTRLERAGEGGRQALADFIEELNEPVFGAYLDSIQIRTGRLGKAEAKSPFGDEACTFDRTFLQKEARGYDGVLFFEDQLHELFGLNEEVEKKEVQRYLADGFRPALRSFLGSIGLTAPPLPYYALLLGDGDHMGRAISGLKTLKKHRALSQAVDSFARGCPEVVARHGGSLIYAGGDDVLALLPLHTVLACADSLRLAFEGALQPACEGVESPTFSIGVAIAHHLQNLVDVREQARQAERLAKKERDSLAIVYKPRSGGRLEFTSRWSDRPDSVFAEWCRLYREERIPDKLAFDLGAIANQFSSVQPAERGPLAPLMASLVRRVVLRKRARKGEEGLEAGIEDRLERRLKASPDPVSDLRGLSSELQIARVFLAAIEEAWGDVTPADRRKGAS